MFDARRPLGWLFLLLPAMVALAVSAQTLPTTTINDTVYRADGTPAGGTLLISWPEFTTAGQGNCRRGQYQRHAWGRRRIVGRLGPERERHPRKYGLLRCVPIG
jgi:hypothetical protein